jgi:beta-1,4-N-acetylglucosaminyltransferase
MGTSENSWKKLCFVTIGATASFDSLIAASLSQDFLRTLRDAGYTDLLLQHGNEGQKIFEGFVIKHRLDSPERQGLNINGFCFNKRGLGWEMKEAKGGDGAHEGVVISHAGTHYHDTSVGKARLKLSSRIWIYIGCPTGRRGPDCCPESRPPGQSPSRASGGTGSSRIRGAWTPEVSTVCPRFKASSFTFIVSDLSAAIRDSENLCKRQKEWPPINSGEDQTGRGLAGVMDDEMGLVD